MRRRWIAAVTALTLGFGSALVATVPAVAADGDVEVIKTASVETVQPGQTFTYTITLTCTSLGAGCSGAQVTDVVPDEFIVDDVVISSGLAGDVTQDGQSVLVEFTSTLPDGSAGIPAGATGSVTIQVHADPDLPYSANGIPVPNTAVTDADTQTSGPLDDTAEVTPVVPLELAVETTKTFDPTSALATPGLPVVAAITATNQSNAEVDTLTISDPADPTATPNPFDQLAFTGVGTVSYPDGAETAQIVYITDGGPVAGDPATNPAQPGPPAGVPPEDVIGVQIVFTSTTAPGIPNGATGGVDLDFEHPDDVGELAGNLTVTNIAESEVGLGDETETDTDDATHEILAANIDVIAEKSFSPEEVAAGDTSTATITAGNGSDFTLSELTITEPTLTDPDDPWADGFDQSMAFAGFTDPIVWPEGASGATITYYYDDGTSEGPLPVANGEEPPAPSGDVVRWSITFTGAIPPEATVDISFDVQTDPDQAGYPATIPNVIDVIGTDPNGGSSTEQAGADLVVYEKHLEVITGKSIYPTTILDRPGEWVLVTLDSQIADFPRSTTGAETIVVQDPANPGSVDGTFWDSFNATAITETAVPAGATLTITYWNGSAWVPLLDASGDPVVVEGPTVFSMEIPPGEQELIQGLQFTYTADDGEPFPPGTSVEPHFSAEVRDTERVPDPETVAPATLANCGQSSATGSGGLQSTPSADDTACAEIDLDPYDPDGDGPDALEKDIEPNVITARSQADARITLNWSTGGLSDVQELTVQDEAAPPASPAGSPDAAELHGSFWDAFDITGVPAITSDMDAYIQYDQVTAVQLWNGSAWVDLENDPCPASCDGAFPGVTLTAADREQALGIRLLWEESPTRAATAAGDLTAPPVGSGVARSTGNDRQIFVDVQLRDYLRSDPAQPAIGTLEYNIDDSADDPDGTIGTVLDVANVTGTDSTGETVIDTDDSDTIAIIDVPLNVDLEKTWSNSPFGVPPDGIPQSAYPTGRVQLTATNRTATKVDTLTISDPTPDTAPEDSPFREFDLYDIRQISIPGGTETTLVTLIHDTDGDGFGDDTEEIEASVALGRGSAALADVVAIVVTHDGRIDAGAVAVVEMDLRLREFVRGTTDTRVATTDSPVTNAAQATVADAGGGTDDNIPTADASATVTLEDLQIGVSAGKTFDPDTQIEPDGSPVVMTLTGQPSVDTSARVGTMVIGDTAPTFWNAFDYVGIDPSFALATPINQVRMDARVGSTFVDTGSGVVAVGGTWEEGPWVDLATFLTTPLPPDVTADQVDSVRFGFRSVDDTGTPVQWENPTDPLQEVPVLVQRRTELRSGGEVPSDLAGNTAAPGEEAPGEFTNESSATVCAILAPTCAIGLPGTVSDFAEDTIFYQHASSEVVITKTPSGQYSPGQSIPYTITVTNSGDWPIANPVIVDAPAAPGTLILNPDNPEPYTFALAGDAPVPPTGTPLPEDPAEVTTVVDEASGTVTFSFADGSALEVGQSYTITIDMIFAPGVPGGAPVTNTATISGDRQFDSCNNVATPVDECSADAVVTPLVAGAVRSGKVVRAVDTELGAFDFRTRLEQGCDAPNAGPLIDPDDEGFYWWPCVPRSKPGGEVVWRFGIQNTGNVALDRLVLVDELPKPGDTGAISDTDRGSQWTPQLDAATLTAVQLPDGAQITYLVTTDAEVCAADVYAPGEPGDPLEACAPGAWVAPLSVDPASITGVRTVVDMPDNPLEPGEVILIEGVTTTPSQNEEAGDDTIAWNSVATGAHTTEDQDTGIDARTMVPSEGTQVGAALATGAIIVAKEVEGDGAQYAPESFEVIVDCTSVGVPVTPPGSTDPDAEWVITVTPPTPELVQGLPWGAECTLDEKPQGQVSFDVDPDTVIAESVRERAVGRIAIENVYELAGLEIGKTVESDAVDANGTPIEFGPFDVSVTCTFLGDEVWAEGYDENDPMVFEIADGDTVTLDGLPANAECIVTESGTANASSTTVASETAEGPVAPVDGTSTTVILTADEGTEITNSVAFVNAYEVGPLQIDKVIAPADSPFAESEFTVHVTCTLGDVTTWDGDLQITPTVPAEVEGIAAGSVCTVEETDTGFANDVDVATSPVTIVPDGSPETALVTVTNTYTEGSLTVTKEIEGFDDPDYVGPFEVTLLCVDPTSAILVVAIPGGPTRELTEAGGWTATYDRLPTGARCILSESDDGGATETQILDADGNPVRVFTIEEDTELSLRVVNTFELGALEVTKTVSGDGAELWGAGPFSVQVSCAFDGQTLPGFPVVVELEADTTSEPFTAPVGSECDVIEDDDGGASSVVIRPNDGSDTSVGHVVVTQGSDVEPVEVTVDNTFDVGDIVVEKVIDGDAAEWAVGDFVIGIDCTWNGEAIPADSIPGGAVRTLSAGTSLTTTYEDLPDGAECTVAETSDGGATSVELDPADGVVVVDPDATEPVTVTVTNVFETASLEVGKTVVSESAATPTQFGFQVVCTFQGETVVDETFTLDGNQTETIAPIPARAECTITETDPRGADATITEADVPGAEGELAPQIDQETRTVVIPELQPDSTAVVNTVSYTNVFNATEVLLRKEVAGAGADQFGADSFVLDYSCTFDGEVVLEGSVELSAANDWQTAVTQVVAGSECTVTEPDLAGADAVVIEPNDGEDLATGVGTVPAEGGLATVTATNWYLTGSLEVTKTFAGDGVDKFGTDEFDLRLLCFRDGEPVRIPDGIARTVSAASPTALWTNLPTGAECSLTETGDGGASSTAILDENGDVVAGDGEPYRFTVVTDPTILSVDDQPQPSLEVQNTFNLAQVSVTKTVAPTTAVDINGDPVTYGPFEVELACEWNGGSVTAAEPMTQTIADGQTIIWTELPEGAECTVTETDTMDAAGTTVAVTEAGVTGDPVDGTVAELAPLPNVDAADQTSVELVNEYLDPPITVTKVVDGAGASDFAGRSFTFDVRCVLIDASHPAPGLLLRDGTYEIGGPIGPLVTLLPTGAECTITEVDTGGADATTITIDGVPLEGTTATTVMGTGAVEIVVTNTFDPVPPPLPPTGLQTATLWTAGIIAVLLLGGGITALVIVRRRRQN
ncbi:hypothetical protein GCM10010460_14640 [Microbacterium terrae]|nr:hypothetical protein GCM10017594_14600 [Microbacterium terrae]